MVTEFYLPALAALGQLANVTVYEPRESVSTEIRTRFPEARVCSSDYRVALADPAVAERFDAAVIALPNRFHEEAVALALNRSLHVLCEKPLALTREACLHLARCSEDVNKLLMVGMVRRLVPSLQALRSALQDGLIGNVKGVDIEDGEPYAWLSTTPAPFLPENGGVLADMGVHYLDIVESLLGPLNPVAYRDDSRGGVEANAEFRLNTETDIPVRLALSRTARLRNTTIVRGERGELVLTKNGFAECSWQTDDGLEGRLRPARPFRSGPWAPTLESCFIEQFANLSLLVAGEEVPYVNAREAASTVGLIEWAYDRPGRGAVDLKDDPSPRPILPASSVVVTGGTGFVGTNLVDRLTSLGCEPVVVPVRSYRTAAPVARFPVDMRQIDLLDSESVARSLTGTRYVFHLAYGRDGDNASRATLEGTRHVVEGAIAAGVEAVVVLSTMYVFGHPRTRESVDETWPYAPAGGEYGTSKAHMERWCLERAETSSETRIVVLNPSCVYGPWGKTYTSMPAEMAAKGSFCWIDGGVGMANYTYVDNLVDAMIVAATSTAGHGQRFIINDGTVSWKEFLTPLLGRFADGLPSYSREHLEALERSRRAGPRQILGAVVRDRELRQALMTRPGMQKTVAAVQRWAPRALDRVRQVSRAPEIEPDTPAGSPPVWLADLFGPTTSRFSSQRARQVLGWEPAVTLADGQSRSADWLRSMRILE